jgi:prepilin-type N-terminal cleavage/methylation domain-containing protein
LRDNSLRVSVREDILRRADRRTDQKGFSLLEVLVAMAIIGVVAAGFMAAMNNATRGGMAVDKIDTARALAQAQMEYVKKQVFRADGDYGTDNALTAEYPGFTVPDPIVVDAQDRDGLIQRITIIVVQNGKTAITLEDCKTK